MRGVARDLREAWRSTRRSPGLSSVVVAIVALGVAVTTSVFCAVNAIWFRPLPYPEPGRLVAIHLAHAQRGFSSLMTPASYALLRGQLRSFASVGAFVERSYGLSGGGSEATQVRGAMVSASLLEMLGATPLSGRRIGAADERPDSPPVAMISQRLWLRRYGAAASVVGSTATIDGRDVAIVGILPYEFRLFYSGLDLFVPLVDHGQDASRTHRVVARLRPDVGTLQAEAELRAVSARLTDERTERTDGWRAGLRPLDAVVWADARRAYLLLLASSTVLLVLICANVSNLLLARSIKRQREFAVRLALGAGRRGIVRLLLAEGLLFAAVAGTMAGGLTSAFARLLVAAFPEMSDYRLDWRVLAFAATISLLCGCVFAIVPAASLSEHEMAGGLKAGASPVLGRRGRTGRWLSAVQIAAAAVLLMTAGLLARTGASVRSIDPGFRTSNLLTASVALPQATWPEPARRLAFYRDLGARIERLPGAAAAALVSRLPIDGVAGPLEIEVERREGPVSVEVGSKTVSESYFTTLGIGLHAGRFFVAEDGPNGPPVALVNRVLARAAWGSEGAAVGARIRTEGGAWRQVVGVVSDVRQDLLAPPSSEVYLPLAQDPVAAVSLIVRSHGEPMAMAPAVRGAVRDLDPDLPVFGVVSMADIVAGYFPAPIALAFASVAGVSLGLGALGLYGLVSFLVARRMREFGVRVALGADRQRLLWMVVGDGLRLAGAGLLAGVVGAVVIGLAVSRVIVGVRPIDPLVLATVSLMLAAVTIVACLAPALRASRVDPIVALRCE